MQVPASLSLAVKSREGYAQDAAERAEMKRLVLEAESRADEGLDASQKLKFGNLSTRGGAQNQGLPGSTPNTRCRSPLIKQDNMQCAATNGLCVSVRIAAEVRSPQPKSSGHFPSDYVSAIPQYMTNLMHGS